MTFDSSKIIKSTKEVLREKTATTYRNTQWL